MPLRFRPRASLSLWWSSWRSAWSRRDCWKWLKRTLHPGVRPRLRRIPMQQRRTIGVGIVLSILAVVCGSTPSGGPTTLVSPSAAAAQERVLTPATLKLGLPTGKTSFANVDVVIAQEMGFFKQQALDVTIQNFDSGVKVVQAVVAGDVAVGGASIEPVVHAAVAGGKVAIIGTYANRLTVSMVTPKTITSVAELRGKHTGIQDVGAFREVMTRMVLESAKLTPHDVSYV